MALITCPECGKEISSVAASCPQCGYMIEESLKDINYALRPTYEDHITKDYSERHRKVTLYLCIFGGYLGIHRFYAKHYKMGILYFLTAGIFFIGWIRDIFAILNGTFFTLHEERVSKHKEDLKVQIEMKNRLVHNSIPFQILAAQISENEKTMNDAVVEYRKITGLSLGDVMDLVYPKYHDGKSRDEVGEEQKQRNKEEWQQLGDNFRNSCEAISNMASKKSNAVKCPKCKSTSISYTNKKLSLGRAAVGGALAGPAGAVLGGVTSKKGYAVCLNCGKKWKI